MKYICYLSKILLDKNVMKFIRIFSFLNPINKYLNINKFNKSLI